MSVLRPDLYQISRINRLNLPNRFIRSATWEGLAAEDGTTTPRLIDLLQNLARGGVGCIISSHAYINSNGQAGRWQLGICKDIHFVGLEAMSKAVHKENGTIIMQLAHGGCNASTKITGKPAVGPSPERPGKQPCVQLSINEINQLTKDFARAAGIAKKAGFDGIQIHAAHGYLLSQFLSRYFNKRNDQYGGSHHNRVRFLIETLIAIRQEVGPDYPVLVKINADDTLPDGVIPTEMVKTAIILEQNGIDAIELSGGCKDGKHLPARKAGQDNSRNNVYYLEAARLFKQYVSVPLILVGGIRSLEMAKYLVENQIADYIAMSRPFIREPNLVQRWQEGDLRPSGCHSENFCYKPIHEGNGVSCPMIKKAECGEKALLLPPSLS